MQLPGSSAGRVGGACSPCTGRGFASRRVTTVAGGLLPHRFTLTGGVSGDTPSAVCFLCHFPSAFAASLSGASCPAVSGLSSKAVRPPRSPGLQPRLYRCAGRADAAVQDHLALGATDDRAVMQHELAAHGAFERRAAQEREELLLERPVERRHGHLLTAPGTLPRPFRGSGRAARRSAPARRSAAG